MSELTSVQVIRGLYDYHHWANRRLFDVAADLGEDAAGRDVGPQFSFPTVRRMLAHIYGADFIWLARFKGTSPPALPGADITSLAALRQRWDELVGDQKAFVESLTPSGLAHVVRYKNTQGKSFEDPLWALLQHVANHATHHRSEVATMLTMLSGSPPSTDIITFHRTTPA
ncbi:MAG TPA: DinB family protein [Methylomirabilota bacterium]